MTFAVKIINEVGFATVDQIASTTINNFTYPLLSQTKGRLVPDPQYRSTGLDNSIRSVTYLILPLLLIGFAGRLLALLGLYAMDRPKQNKLTCVKIIQRALGRLSCCKALMKKRSCSSTSTVAAPSTSVSQPNEPLDNATSISVTNPLEEHHGTHANEVEEQIRKITRGSFANIDFDALDDGSNSHTQQIRSKRRTTLLNATNVVSGVLERSEETWSKRLGAHGTSSQQRILNRKHQLATLFELWDKLGDGFIDPDDMKTIAKQYKSKIHVSFGNALAWKRVQNVGVFSHGNFDQFFNWFVLEPTIDQICKSVMKGNPKKVKEIANRRSNVGGGGGGPGGGRQRANTSNDGERKVALPPAFPSNGTEGKKWQGRADRLRQLKHKKKSY